MYGVGDKVVHPMHGAGVIDGITQEKLNGRCCTYYVFKMYMDDLVLKIPEESCGRIGMPLSRRSLHRFGCILS